MGEAMTKNDLALEKELARSLFEDVPIERLLKKFADKEVFSKITKQFLDKSSPLSFICACTCEGLLAKSHFYSSTFMHALVCLDKLQPYRLENGHKIKEFEELFNNSDLANEPFYLVKGVSNESLKFINREVIALKATEKILNIYSGKPNMYHLHPYKVYWFLVSRLDIDKNVASRYHSTQGLLRLIIQYILYYNDYKDGEYIEVDRILNLYEQLGPDIKKDQPVVLPIGVDYEFTQVSKIIETFFDEFIKFSNEKNKDEKLLDLSRLTNMAIQTLRLLNEYQSGIVTKKMDSLLSMMDERLMILYNDLRENRLAKYYYYERWREKCKITTRYHPLPFLTREDRESDIFQLTIQELQAYF